MQNTIVCSTQSYAAYNSVGTEYAGIHWHGICRYSWHGICRYSLAQNMPVFMAQNMPVFIGTEYAGIHWHRICRYSWHRICRYSWHRICRYSVITFYSKSITAYKFVAVNCNNPRRQVADSAIKTKGQTSKRLYGLPRCPSGADYRSIQDRLSRQTCNSVIWTCNSLPKACNRVFRLPRLPPMLPPCPCAGSVSLPPILMTLRHTLVITNRSIQ